MRLLSMSSLPGLKRLSVAGGILLLSMHLPAAAETITTVNGLPIDSQVFDFYAQSRTQRTADQLSPEERDTLLQELKDVYLLATQSEADEVRSDPQIVAQLELQKTSLIAQTVATLYITSMEITDEEIQAEYDEQAALSPGQEYKARHILVESQGEAAAIIEELQGGADFETLARERSTGPSGPNGGDLGWFNPNQMVAPFSAAVQAMEDGAYSSEPVQTDFGWHVILREDSRASVPPPLDSVRDTVRQAIQQRKFQAYLEGLRSSATE